MSKLKSPRAKKVASLAHDHRNAPGENGKASRKNVPRAKARTQRTHRRAVHQALVHAEPLVSEVVLQDAENGIAKAARDRKAKGFRKEPDLPLGEVIAEKKERRKR